MATFKIVNPSTLAIEHSYEADEAIQYGGPWGQYPHLEVVAPLDPDCVKAELVGDVLTLVEDSALVTAKAAASKQALVQAAYDRMNSDIVAEMSRVYVTSIPDPALAAASATADNETFKNMKSSPSSFSSKGYKAEKAVGSFQLGDALDTDQKVIDYANARLTETLNFAVYRLERIEQFKTERAAILNG